jgi:hypothetical protein
MIISMLIAKEAFNYFWAMLFISLIMSFLVLGLSVCISISPLKVLGGGPDYNPKACRHLHAETLQQLCVKELLKVLMLKLGCESNPRPIGREGIAAHGRPRLQPEGVSEFTR